MHWLTQLDERLFLAVNGWGSRAMDPFFWLMSFIGQGVTLAVIVLGPMALFDKRRLRVHALPMILSIALGALAVEGIKSAVNRDRPARHFTAATSAAACRVRMPVASLYERSFPSGHAQAAFGTATYVSLIYRRLAVPAAVVALLIGVSRIYLGVHFPIDVLAGALLGIGFSVCGFLLRRRALAAHREASPGG